MSKKSVLSVAEWDVNAVRYMTPKVNDKGGKSINIISSQTNRTLSISTPLLMTWGVSDFIDDKGEADGKFMISLVFPTEDYSTKATNDALHKIKQFEDKFLDDSVVNCDSWFGESWTREIAKHSFFPILKYPKVQDESTKNMKTKKLDYTRPPTIKAKVPLYDGKWGVEIYDTKSNLIFPNGDPKMTPMDFIPKGSIVACVLAFSQVWVGGKGMGITTKLVQCIVKPREVISSIGKCQISLTDDDMEALEYANEVVPPIVDNTTTVCDSDDDELSEPIPVLKPIVKKVVKKAAVNMVEVVKVEEAVEVEEKVEVEETVKGPKTEDIVVPGPGPVPVPGPGPVVKPNMVIKKKVIKKA
jgi:hypothetical protein